jgi:hypothetical protein
VNNLRDYTTSEDNYRLRLFQDLFSTNFGTYPDEIGGLLDYFFVFNYFDIAHGDSPFSVW